MPPANETSNVQVANSDSESCLSAVPTMSAPAHTESPRLAIGRIRRVSLFFKPTDTSTPWLVATLKLTWSCCCSQLDLSQHIVPKIDDVRVDQARVVPAIVGKQATKSETAVL